MKDTDFSGGGALRVEIEGQMEFVGGFTIIIR